ncbi:MAG: hypothetical protein HY348_05175, partial [Nitrospira defluvii]|nr:hypothetical protein [Nitrospira defluvii]
MMFAPLAESFTMSLTIAAMMLAPPLPPGACVISPQPAVGLSYEAANQLTADAIFAYQYDDNGNLTRKTLLATEQKTEQKRGQATFLGIVVAVRAGAGWIPGPRWWRSP